MFDKLEDLLIRFEELMSELSEPDVANDPVRFRKLMKEQSDLTPIVNAYKEYKQCKQNIEDSLALLEEESDEEMRELAKEELNDSKARVEELEKELKILLLPNHLRRTSCRTGGDHGDPHAQKGHDEPVVPLPLPRRALYHAHPR